MVSSSVVDQVVQSVPVRNPSAVDHVAQVVQLVHSSLEGEGRSTGAFKPKEIFTSVNLPVDAEAPLKLKTNIWNNECIDFGFLLANQFVVIVGRLVQMGFC